MEEEKIVEIYFSDDRTIFPYQTVSLTTKKETKSKNSDVCGLIASR